jgi:phosphopantothenoylcysteine decarboxylase/phosphopantothenate--cysteine ligase
MFPRGREIVLGVGGSISAYKSCDLLRRLQDQGFLITVVPTRASLNFVGVATWEALSHRAVAEDLWNNVQEVPHVALGKKADAVVIAPATADLLARIAQGRADDLLTNIVLTATCPIIVVPAMHTEMWLNDATQKNVKTLRSRGFVVIEPEVGKLTGGDVGAGRYPKTKVIIQATQDALKGKADYLGVKVLVSAGGTREAIDPVRYIGNRSSGKQGYALAYAAAKRGAEVTLVSENAELEDIEGVTTIHVETANQMQAALVHEFDKTDLVIMSAAVADVRPESTELEKISKSGLKELKFKPNDDILKALSSMKKRQVLVGFAAQTGPDGLSQAKEKLRAKGLDLLYFNDVTKTKIFGEDETEGVVLDADGGESKISRVSKVTLADKILDLALHKLG